MNAVTLRPVRCVQGFRELVAFEQSEVADWPEFGSLRIDSINAAFVIASAHVNLRQPIGRNPAWVFDQKAVHVHEPKRAIWTRANLHRSEPIVGGGEEF